MTFKFTYYTKRWGHKDTLRIEKTATGWHVEHLAINGESKPDGNPFVFANLTQDYVKYPTDLGPFLEYLWEQLDTGEIDDARAQQMFDQLGEWVSQCETSQPTWKGWNA